MGATADRPRLNWQADWRTSLFVAVFLPLFLWLGNWQLGRADEKRDIASRYEARRQAPPLPLQETRGTSDELAWRRVTLAGEFDNHRQFLLDNRMHQGRYGFEVLSPFRISGSERVVMVNRGWVEGDPARRSLPEVPAISGPQLLQGSIYVPPGEPYTLARDEQLTGDWPRTVQVLDIPAMANQLDTLLYPYSVRLASDSSAALTVDWPVVNQSPEKHTAYAVQWFAMALVLLLLYLLRSTNLAELWRARGMKS